MKQILALIICTLAMSAAVTGAPRSNENTIAPEECDSVAIFEADSAYVDSIGSVPVVGAFGLRDTVDYTASFREIDVVDGDSTVKSSVDIHFRMAVVDTTEDDYTMHLEVLRVEAGSDFKSAMRAAAFNSLKGFPVVVKTDYTGSEAEIENWKEVGKRMLHACENTIDSTFKSNPELGKVVKVDAMKTLYSKTLADEEGVTGSFEMLGNMFANHGKEYTAGVESCDTVAATDHTPAYVVREYADYGRVDSTDTETEFDDDYFVLGNVSSTLDGKDVTPLVQAAISGLLSKESGIDTKTVDKELSKVKSVVVEHDSKSFYYFNGWPKACMFTTSTVLGPLKRIKQQLVLCNSFSWGN